MGNVCGSYVLLNIDEKGGKRSDKNRNRRECNPDSSEATNNIVDGAAGDSQISTLEISRKIQRLMLTIRGDFMTEDGKRVDYDAIKKSDTFAEYEKTVKLLSRCQLGSLDEDERKAFFINVYNALNIHGIIARNGGLPDSLWGKLGYWKWTGYEIECFAFSLDDIEHGILRGNALGASQFWGNGHFNKNDPRLKYSLPKDARIHFALNCGARSCPAIRVYDAKNLERGLKSATLNFCESEVDVVEKRDDAKGGFYAYEFRLSHLFKWFRRDFVPAGIAVADPVLHWIIQNTEPTLELARKMREALESGKEIIISYTPYDWTNNGS